MSDPDPVATTGAKLLADAPALATISTDQEAHCADWIPLACAFVRIVLAERAELQRRLAASSATGKPN